MHWTGRELCCTIFACSNSCLTLFTILNGCRLFSFLFRFVQVLILLISLMVWLVPLIYAKCNLKLHKKKQHVERKKKKTEWNSTKYRPVRKMTQQNSLRIWIPRWMCKEPKHFTNNATVSPHMHKFSRIQLVKFDHYTLTYDCHTPIFLWIYILFLPLCWQQSVLCYVCLVLSHSVCLRSIHSFATRDPNSTSFH